MQPCCIIPALISWKRWKSWDTAIRKCCWIPTQNCGDRKENPSRSWTISQKNHIKIILLTALKKWLHFDYTFQTFYTFSHCFRRFLCIRKIAVSKRKNTGNPWFYWISGVFSVKLEKGLEPSTPSLRVKCSTDWAIPASVSSIAADSNYYTWLLSVLQVFSQK